MREYSSTPHSTTGRTPAELMLGRQFRNQMSLLQPALTHIEKKQQLEKPVRPTKYANGDHVLIRNYGINRKVKWVPGRVTSSVGTGMFIVQGDEWSIFVMSTRCASWSKVLLTHSQPPPGLPVPFPVATLAATPTRGIKMREAEKGYLTRNL